MLNHEQLIERTESYLKALIADAAGLADGGRALDATAPFGELGVDSFRVLKIIKALEGDFGVLPKTLLFENFNIESLARYFAEKHAAVAAAKFAGASAVAEPVAPSPLRSAAAPATVAVAAPVQRPAEPIRLLEQDLPHFPALEARVRELFDAHKNEGCVSRGTRNIAPNLFVGAAQRGYFNYARSGHTVLVYAYTGPEDYFAEIAREMSVYCAQRGFQFNLFIDHALERIGDAAFTATPFGVLQRVHGLREFSLEGGAMKRLRYQIAKFEKAGDCRTVEYACGSDPAVDREIAAIVDRWCDGKTMVNPLIQLVREEIVQGRLHPQHRLFLTWLDGALQNVILISRMSQALNGYLMDLEFYPREMPLGGLEYAIVNIMRTLREEGCDLLSLGGTYGCRLETSANADPAVDRILDDLHSQGIFNDEGNLQFKNKFRPENRTIYLCRPAAGSGGDNVLDLIMMIADPARTQTSEADNHTHRPGAVEAAPAQATSPAPAAAARNEASSETQGAFEGLQGQPRSFALARHGFNPLNLPAGDVEFDLKTDSWAQLDSDYVAAGLAALRARLGEPADLDGALRGLFPFRHFVLAGSGRDAERLLCRAWGASGTVLQNLLFPTAIYHQIEYGLSPRELPHPQLFQLDAPYPYKAELDWPALQQALAEPGATFAFCWIELSDNASGGQPLSLAHLRKLKAALAERGIALVLDATRALENAHYLAAHSPEFAGRDMWDALRELLSCADAATVSLAKDFGVAKGGVIACNDEALLRRLQEAAAHEGEGLDAVERKLLALALSDRDGIAARIQRRVAATAELWRTLKQGGVPVVAPAGGHCVLIDVKAIAAFAGLGRPVASFLAWLYLATGVRAGAHSVGMQKGNALDALVRLAVPVGLKPEQAAQIGARIAAALAEPRDIPELHGGDERLADPYARFALRHYLRSSAAQVAVDADEAAPAAETSAVAIAAPALVREDIAIVGMGGRYPGAASLDEFWDNLRSGRDSVGPMPRERLARRQRKAPSRDYRGGFLDCVDRFDSLFFNISPREAEVLDPQERLFLEVAWETLEDAGYYPELLAQDPRTRKVGVFVGAVWAMYQMLGVEEKLAGRPLTPNSFLWSVANRVSYWMNFSGPSLSVDTACSSSLTALHLACEAIRNGDCTAALVGGVNLDLHQHKFDINNAGGALSPDGVCSSFGASANGYVAGEGVGALLLKPLSQALADHDQIYGVIRGAVVNHGGRTSGYTVPNPRAQGELVAAALAKAGVDPASVGYIEAHGTGTELGDPIEIAGLTQAFASAGLPTRACAVGSVKTNIGHLEAAAGVVGVSKVLLQMRHRQLVPSLHSAELNPHIDFDATPFYVQRELQDWTPRGAVPLRAGVSSFGAGGANAHVVIEQYPSAVDEEPAPAPLLFPLSARTPEQLREMAQRLRAHLLRDFVAHRTVDIAYTLQHGRKTFEHRLALIASSRDELIARLDAFLSGAVDADALSGHARGGEGLTKLLDRSEREQLLDLLARNRDPRKLAQLWIEGLLPDCRGLAADAGRRVSLPTYPFADKRHWIAGDEPLALAGAAGASLHPLLDRNESTFQRQLFVKRFRADEFVLAEHLVSGRPTLPGTAYLEMARKAGELATGCAVRAIRNVTWISPLSAEPGAATEAWIELKPAAESVQFEVFGDTADGGKRSYAQGRLLFRGADDAPPADEFVDLDAIRARCAPALSGPQAYPLFEGLGMRYGASFQALQEVARNPQEVLARLRLPALREADAGFELHPCLLDAAMQAGVVAQLGDAGGEMKVPYSLGEVELRHPLSAECYSYVTRGGNAGSAVSRDDVTIVDANGRVLARIREAVGVPLTQVHEKPAAAHTDGEAEFEELYYSHEWRAAELGEGVDDGTALWLLDNDEALYAALRARGVNAALAVPGEDYADLGGGRFRLNPREREHYARALAALAAQGRAPQRIVCHWAKFEAPQDDAALDAALAHAPYALLALAQALAESKPAGRVRLCWLHRGGAALQPHNEAVDGFLRSLALEHPKFDCKTVALDEAPAERVALRVLAELDARAQLEPSARYRDGAREIRRLARVEPAAYAAPAARENPVYVITGGAGGLGLLFAEHFARQGGARLLLTGRSALDPQREAELERLRALGAQVIYAAADVSRADEAERVLALARDRHGRIDGIVHAAGVLRDSFARNKSAQDLDAVFAPKIRGALHLDRFSAGDELDCFVLFSSLAALGGNTGQCDYAYANHWLDSFAAQRDSLRAAGLRHGRSLSVNWSLWADGGMKLDAQTELFFRKNLGIKPLDAAVGVAALAKALSLGRAQVAVLEGARAKIEQAWGLNREIALAPLTAPAIALAAAAPAQTTGNAGQGDALAAEVVKTLSALVMDMLKLGADELDLDGILLDLGFDSIGLTGFANAINERYALDIIPVLFFEYPSIRAIAGALTSEHAEAVRKVHATAGTPAAAAPAAAAAVRNEAAPASTPAFAGKQWQAPSAPAEAAAESAAAPGFAREERFAREPIAIVGIAGTLPQSDDLHEFWLNLEQERDLVTEIPRDRWIWEDVHGNPLKEANKSYSKWGGFMREVDKFDPLFFGITPREAEMMDPQQRLLIQAVWSAIEDSGHKVSDLSGTRTGLFVGVSAKDYIDVLAEHQSTLDGYSASGNSHSILANRVSYLFNLRGPSAPLDTACSSSLVALHRAIESIHTGSSEMAIVAGVQVMLTSVAHISLSSAGMLSPDGRCRTFNKDANGYVRGEGVGAVLIKPLARALADGDPIHAVIRATAENHGGRVTNLTAPNPKAQAELLVEAYDKARIDPATVGYIECHGTGTSLGDPIEIQALKKSFADLYARHGRAAPAQPHCGLSSVKTNIGHLEPAAGMAGLLKALLAMRHGKIPALLHFEELNPYIDLKGSPFYIVDRTVDWPAPRGADGAPLPRRAGVSSFGWGGANAHVVLEEHARPERSDEAHAPVPVLLSARDGERLRDYAGKLAAHLRREPAERCDLRDLAYTLQIGRDPMNERLALMAASREELAQKLQAFADGGEAAGLRHGRVARGKDEAGLLGDDEDIRRSVIAQLVAAGKWERVLELWVKGLDPDWATLHAAGAFGAFAPRRLSLPTYPFARERYWIDTSAKPAKPASTPEAAPAKPAQEPAQHLFFHERWQALGPAPAEPARAAPTVLVFGDDADFAACANDAELAHAVPVRRGEAMRALERGYECREGDAEQLQSLLRALPAGEGEALEIVYAWSRGRGEAGVRDLFALFTAIKHSGRAVSRVVLAGDYDPRRAETCWDYAWIGFERSLKLHLARTAIALVYADDGALDAAQAWRAGVRGGALWRRGGRWLQLSYAAHELPDEPVAPLLKHGGGYLITGGCGALGQLFARHLAREANARLLLTGRSPMSERIQAQLDELRALGAVDAVYHALDLGDEAAMAAWPQTLPFALCGVLHAAGVESHSAFFEKSAADLDAVLRPKTAGSAALDRALAAQPLDFVCYFSSSSAMLGDFGACDYAIANRYQMAYAEHRRGSGAAGRTLAINWPLWAQGGMGAADPAQTAAYLKRTGLEALRSEDGLAIWRALLGEERGQTLVMAGQPGKVGALLDRLYGLAPGARGDGGRSEVQALLGGLSRSAPARSAGELDAQRLQALRSLIKAELLGLQAAEK
jgi:polyketide synthase PksN